MTPHFDIFKIKDDGSPLWVEAAETFDAASARAKELLKVEPAVEYVIFDQETQESITFRSGASVES